MSVKSRVERLEKGTMMQGDFCTCTRSGSLELRQREAGSAEDTGPAATCEVCGLPKQIVNVIFPKGVITAPAVEGRIGTSGEA